MELAQNAARERIKAAIEKIAFVRSSSAKIISGSGMETGAWLFDLRAILMRSDIMTDVAEVFWETFKQEAPLQIGCIESGGIPLMSGLVALAREHGVSSCDGFFIRKSRKKTGLLKAIEGEIDPERTIVLVDDLINSGKSFMRQVEVLEEAGHHVKALWCLVQFRDPEVYTYFKEKKIRIHSLFELDDFTETLGVKNFERKNSPQKSIPFSPVWKFSSPDPSYFYVVAKSDIALDESHLYFGSDSGIFWALNQSDGSVAWSFKTGFHPKGKGIFSSPAIHDGIVFFGAYDGNVYALDAQTGRKKWIFFDADWVGSSPALSPDLGLLYIGLEFGLWRKRGGIAAVDMKTGTKIWHFLMPCFTHSTPLYIKEHRQVVIGSNDGAAYLFDAQTGSLQWKFETGILNDQEMDTGFSRFDIKEAFAYDTKRDLIIFGTMGGKIFFVNRKSGMQRSMFTAGAGFYSTPVVYRDSVLVSSLDKNLYCIDLDTFAEKWYWSAGARIFATPTLIGESVFLGANTGRLTEIDPKKGIERSFLTLTERITNKIAYNPLTKRLFIPTFANEVYCVEKTEKR